MMDGYRTGYGAGRAAGGYAPVSPGPEPKTVVGSSAVKGVFGFSVSVPPETQDGDMMIAFVVRRGSSKDPGLGSNGWTLLSSSTAGDTRTWAYSRVASSEPASYSIASDLHAGAAIVTIRGGSPSVADHGMIDASNNVAPSVGAAAAGDILVCFWAAASGTTTAIAADAYMIQLEATGDGNVQLCLAAETLRTSGATGTRTSITSNIGNRDSWSVAVTGP